MEWAKQGACLGTPVEWWFPEDEAKLEPDPRHICRKCPVKADCLAWALDYERYGIWADTLAWERRIIRQNRGLKIQRLTGLDE